MALEDFIIKMIIYLGPMYFANSSAMFFGGKTPLDFGKKFSDGRRIFGKGKTFKGSFFGIAFGTLIGVLIFLVAPAYTLMLSKEYILLVLFITSGAIVGDIVASFFKRRHEIDSGEEVLFLDQLDFVIGGMLFGSILYVPDFYEVVFICVTTLIVHKVSNYVAYKIKLKKVPW